MLGFLKVLLTVFAISLSFFTAAPAIQANGDEAYDDIEEAALAPDSPFYFLKGWQESIERFITNFQGEEALADLEVKFAQRRVGEMRRLAQLGINGERMEELRARWENHIQQAQERAENTLENRETVRERILEQLDRHRSVMERVYEQAPDEAKDAVNRAIENYETNRSKLLESFSESKRGEIEEHLQERLENTVDRFNLNPERFHQLQNRTTQ